MQADDSEQRETARVPVFSRYSHAAPPPPDAIATRGRVIFFGSP